MMEPRRTHDDDPIAVEISDTQGHLRVDRSKLVDLARRTLRHEGRSRASLSIAIVDDAAIHAINRRHLDHDWPTDVITFPLSEPDDPELAAELVISAEMARKTAEKHGVDPWNELALYLVHGLLHLCGQDDQTEAERAVMRRREAVVLAALDLVNPNPAVVDPTADVPGGPAWKP